MQELFRPMKKNMNKPDYPLELTTQIACEGHPLPTEEQIRQWVLSAIDLPTTMTVRFVNEEEGLRLNHDFRKKSYATNVLTFDYQCEEECEADLVLCPIVIEKEAKEQQKDLMAHYAHLIIHGTLHAIGYDHETDGSADIMESWETSILLSLGFEDPYLQDINE